MNTSKLNDRTSSIAMIAMGIGFAVLYPKNMYIEKVGWIWDFPERNLALEHMLIAIYVALGIFFLWGARDPRRYTPLINYTIIMSILHGSVMWYDAAHLPQMHNHLGFGGDVLGTYVPLLLICFHPNRHQWWSWLKSQKLATKL